MKQNSLSHKKTGFLANYIPNGKERERINVFLIITIGLILAEMSFIYLNRQSLMTQNFRHYKEIFKQFGSIAQIGFYTVLSIYPIFLLLKNKHIKGIKWRSIE